MSAMYSVGLSRIEPSAIAVHNTITSERTMSVSYTLSMTHEVTSSEACDKTKLAGLTLAEFRSSFLELPCTSLLRDFTQSLLPMSTQLPDPKTLQSWEDAFQYPLPVVRKLEQQLRKNIDENRQKLRSLAGTSYRDLLGTAERIIEMDEQIQQAEQYMGDIGRKCNARTLERIGANHAQRMREGREGNRRYRVLAQTKVLQCAIAVSGRIVRKGGDALVAAKLLVLARLVHKSLAEGGEGPAVLEELRRKLGQMRKRLLGYISRFLVKADGDKDGMVQTLCAYALMTSSAPKDTLRYFLQVRFEQLESKAEMPSEGTLLDMLDLYSQTLLDTREVFPRRFADSLSQLSKAALVWDSDVRGVSELSLDVYEQWITDDVRNFHPWVRHDQVSTTEVGDALASWAKQAQACLLQGLSDALKAQSDAHAVLSIRKQVLSKYLSLSTKLRSDSHTQAVNDIRAAFLSRLEELAVQAAKLPPALLNAQQLKEDPTAAGMWDLSTDNMDLNDGALGFRQEVIRRQHGRSSATESVASVLDQWIGSQNDLGEAIASMRAMKWVDDLDLDLEDLPDGESLQEVLSKQDPQQLEARLLQETLAAMKDAYHVVEESSESITEPALLLQIIREVDQRRRNLQDKFEGQKPVKADDNLIAATHRQQAMSIIEDPVAQYSQAVRSSSRTSVALWDGTPALPIQPAPNTFRFLKSLHRKMSDAGTDLWSPAAVQVLKNVSTEKLKDQLGLDAIDQSKAMTLTNGHPDASPGDADQTEAKAESSNGANATTDTRRNYLMQHMFDLLYLQCVFSTNSSEVGKLDSLTEAVTERLELDASAHERLKKSASDYWKRTYLLFGLLAVGHK